MIFPIGIQNFENLRNRGYVYVDKTEQIYRLVTTGTYYFLSRPRRFGKSLLVSTLEAYFQGRRELFDGLAIGQLEREWTVRPVLHLDLNTAKYDSPEALGSILNRYLSLWEKQYGTEASENTLAGRFEGIIRRASEQTGQQVVILIDEYDKPLTQAITNEKLREEYRGTLKAFYSVMKTQDRYIRFALLTGVTKFGKISVFSDLNNLKDISMDERYIDICGITEEEMHRYFEDTLHSMARKEGMAYDELCRELRLRYDGYHFEAGTVGLYNPFSLLCTLDKQKFGEYWFETGTPTFLIELLRKADYDLNGIQEEAMTSDVLNSTDSLERNPIPIIYQSGYLTIKGYDKEFGLYQLGFPNREVENGFTRYLLPFYTPVPENKAGLFVANFVRDVQAGRAEAFMERMQTLFDDADYRIAGKMEIYFQNVMYIIFKLLGLYVSVERTTARGRIDVVVTTHDYIYVMELKLDGSADEALRQIEERGYVTPFRNDPRRLLRIGVSFSSETRGISEWKIEEG